MSVPLLAFEDDEEEADSGSDSTSSEEEKGKNKVRQPETVDFEPPPDCVEFPADQVPAYRELPYQQFVQPNSMSYPTPTNQGGVSSTWIESRHQCARAA
jgi:hypothetical protein